MLNHLIDLEGIDISKGLESAKNDYEKFCENNSDS
jgi:hypothetical protein